MSTTETQNAIELWGGLECTINRIGDRFIDQLQLTGVYDIDRLIETIAPIGFTRMRWPVLWERVVAGPSVRWDWADRTLGDLRRHHIEPIVGLVHHGSGPSDLHLLHPAFPDRLASYARSCAERFPWVRLYTPVNEPLTTARFAALYGHWYPHKSDGRSFVTALVTQVRGTIAAMEAIRQVRPDAGLVQTEDAGSTRATPPLLNQAEFETRRRWLSLDLLTGRVDDAHPLRAYLDAHGFTEEDARWFREHAVQPEIVGLNYYVTSDRFLDHRLTNYPAVSHGGNGRQRYADIDAARVEGVDIRGHAAVLREAWERYQLPVAITEAHLGCTREEQVRWLRDAWTGANEARNQGADVRAVTVWALFGSSDWDSLVTTPAGHYESGPFDVRGRPPRPTALASAAAALARTGVVDHPAIDGPGWWDRRAPAIVGRRPLLILGATGTLGRAFEYAASQRALAAVSLSRRDLDVLNPDAVSAALREHRPWAVVNATGYVRVDDAEVEVRACRQVNAVAPAILAMACRKNGIRLATFSSDLVFDGEQTEPYCEDAPVGPLNTYGRSKVEGERRVLAIDPDALVIRTSAFFGPWDRANFVTIALERLAAGQPFRTLSDLTVSPTYVPHLVDASLDLLIDGADGLWHLANRGAVTWHDFARLAAARAGVDASHLDSCPSEALKMAARRPRYSVLGSGKGMSMPLLEEALDRYVYDRTRVTNAA